MGKRKVLFEHSEQVETALAKLLDAFEILPVPPLEDLPGDGIQFQIEEQLVYKIFGGKKWTELHPNELENSALPLILSLEGFHYYFPGLVYAALKVDPYLVDEFWLASPGDSIRGSFISERFELFDKKQIDSIIFSLTVLQQVMVLEGDERRTQECTISIRNLETFRNR